MRPELSIIVCTFRMQREAPRTLHSLLPGFQQGVSGIPYEIIVIDNGSPEPLRLPPEQADDPRVELVRIENAHPSPVFCINDAVAARARGSRIMVLIDGARMVSNRVVERSVRLSREHPRAFIYTISRHIGDDIQPNTVKAGYTRAIEDRIFTQSNWRKHPDALFAISVLAGSSSQGDLHPVRESNCFTMSRSLWDEIEGYNEGFTSPGGGLANLEFFNRCVTRPNALNICLYGEATFHQHHGGIATAREDYFNQHLPGYVHATGQAYASPRYGFLVDSGAEFGRGKKATTFAQPGLIAAAKRDLGIDPG